MVSEHAGSDTQLVLKACAGDPTARQELWRAHRRWVAAIVLAHKPRSLEVDDLMQDVAVKFVSKLATLRDPEAFRPWLRRIVINVCRGAARSLRPTATLNEQHDDPAVRGPVPGPGVNLVEQRDAAQLVLAQLMSLPLEYREPLLLRCLRALTYQQISTILDLPVTTVETRLARARRMLRDEVGESLAIPQPRPGIGP